MNQLKSFFSATLLLLVAVVNFVSEAADSIPKWQGNLVLEGTTVYEATVGIASELAPLEINKIHSWLLNLNDDKGDPIAGATITLEGGMPDHDHGLPTSPQITSEIAPGIYLLEGVRFHMQGFWQLDIDIQWQKGNSSVNDSVRIDFTL